MRILFIGTGDIGVPALQSLINARDHTLAAIVTQPDKPVGRHQELLASPIKQLALRNNIPVFQPLRIREPAAIEEIQKLKPDVIVVMAYGQILPRAVLDAPLFACLNLHASLLPRFRGASPVQAAIEAGDRETGITVMHVAEGLDTGDIFLAKRIPIRRRETGGSLHDRLAALAPEALIEALEIIGQGNLHRVPQENSSATYASKLTRENGHIDWEANALAIGRTIRAMNPWPAAFTTLGCSDGQIRKLKVFSAIVCRKVTGAPGVILHQDRNGILVGTGMGAILLREIQLEGKKRMSARDFLLGHPLPVGTILGSL